MGDTITKLTKDNACMNRDDDQENTPPKYHFKCRFHDEDAYCITQIYTRTDKTPNPVPRFQVPRNKIKWSVELEPYTPAIFTSAKILTKDGLIWKDPHVDEEAFGLIRFNAIDDRYKCDRTSFHGKYEFIPFSNDLRVLVPRNPVGRTGLVGRGHLGRWGPNHAADSIVTTWKRDNQGAVMVDPDSKKPILRFVSIQRKDTKEWAIPGGMRDPGEVVTKTLVREFSEEALNEAITFDKAGNLIHKEDEAFQKRLTEFFRDGTQIYKGYVDDPRNTDNAWMETIACNFHDEHGDIVGQFKLQGGDDAEKATWHDLSSKLKLFASHVDFLRQVAIIHKAHW